MDKEKILEAIENMTVLELNELVEACEEKFGVSYADNALATFMTVLMKKGFVSRYKKRHSYQYVAEISKEEYLKKLEIMSHENYSE